MMRPQRSKPPWRALAMGLGATLALLVAVPALATTLDEAKAAGQIGEGPDGFLHIVKAPGDAAVQALVSDINAKRKAKYAEIAAENGAPLDAVAARAGAKLVERTPPGQYYLDASGQWHQR